jgi:hypothetical protein
VVLEAIKIPINKQPSLKNSSSCVRLQTLHIYMFNQQVKHLPEIPVCKPFDVAGSSAK